MCKAILMPDKESKYEQKIRKAWERYGEEVGEIVGNKEYDKRFRKIINKYGKGLDQDELYSTLVMYSMPLYIENWNPCHSTKSGNNDLISWICYCIYLRILKYRSAISHELTNQDNYDKNNCPLGHFSSIEVIESELYEELSVYEVYLLRTIAVDGYSIPDVAKVNHRAPATIRKDFRKTLDKCRRLLR